MIWGLHGEYDTDMNIVKVEVTCDGESQGNVFRAWDTSMGDTRDYCNRWIQAEYKGKAV
jgi:hypothetical protein